MKKCFVSLITLLIGAVGGIHLFDALTQSKITKYNHETLISKKLSKRLDGYKIAFISDIHNYPVEELKSVVKKINLEKPDLFLIGGDFSDTISAIHRHRILAEVKAKDGSYGVEGNHDMENQLLEIMPIYGIKPLQNTGVNLRKGIYLAGLGDYYNHRFDLAQSLKDRNQNDFTILLLHHPDLAMKLNTKDTDLILAGHIHGGEVNVFGRWAPRLSISRGFFATTEYRQKFVGGWTKSEQGTPIYVSRGLGKHLMRTFNPPEVTFITLKSAEK